MPHIDRQQLRKFAEDGYIVLPQVVSPGLVRAARSAVADRLRQDPPPAGHRGPHFYFLFHDLPDALLSPLYQSPAIDLAGSLLAAGASFDTPEHIQISLNIPPWSHRPGGPHIDGITPPESDGRPGTFTMLAGIFLTDQSQESAGNLWVWLGSHREAGAYFLEHGPESLISCTPYPPVPLQPPRQVTARAGDVLLAHTCSDTIWAETRAV